MANTVTVTNLTMGPGDLYKGAVGAEEPTDAAVNAAPAASAWAGMGGTQDGVKLTISQNYEELEVDQIVDVPGRRKTKREFVIETNLAELTLDNLATALNESPPVTAAGYSTLDVTNDNSATQPNYYALIFDGYAPAGYRRRIIGRRMLSTDDIEFAYVKDKQAVYKVQFSSHYVSSSVKPFHIVDQTAS